MCTNHKLILGNSMSMIEIPDETVHLMITSPPYFNAPFDYEGLFKSYEQYLGVLKSVAKETHRVLQKGRIVVLNIDDMLVKGEKYPITADAIKIFQSAGFRYRDKIIWKKPDGYLRISRRSGVLLQNPYPMYFYPDNLLESIIIFQKGKFNYKSVSKEVKQKSKINKKEFQDKKWYMTLWQMTNVLPGSPLEKDIAAFPEELPYRAINLFSYKGETVLDPFAGSGTTMKVARDLKRDSIGIEINKDLEPIIREKVGFGNSRSLFNINDTFKVIYRSSTKYGYYTNNREEKIMNISAEIKGIKYEPFLCSKMKEIDFSDFEKALSSKSSFILKVDPINKIAVSCWVSAKRTRSYPYARVYNTLSFSGKKITIIPIFKDEGKDGDRDFLQWDTISLMSLLGVYVIVGYYTTAIKNKRYENKITSQRYDIQYLRNKIKNIISYQSDALHWNLAQIETIGNISETALKSYKDISKKLQVEMHSFESAQKRIDELLKGKDNFMILSRDLAKKAQVRESITEQPKEFVTGEKGVLTIKNYLGGYYYFTSDKARLEKDKLFLVEAKHSKSGNLPSTDDIKDGLIKMILFTNLSNVKVNKTNVTSNPILKLTTGKGYDFNNLTKRQKQIINLLVEEESKSNNFKIELL